MLLLALACATHTAPVPPLYPGRQDGLIIGERHARVLVPGTWDGTTPLPVVVLLGGYSSHTWELEQWMDLAPSVEGRGLLLVMPEGSLDRKGKPFWKATDTCCDWYGSGVDDLGFLTGVLDEVARRYPVDPAHVGVMGHSNGAFMGFALACQPDTPVTHLVSIGGSSFLDPAACAERGPLALLQVHGDSDRVMPLEGDAEAPPIQEVLDRWRTGSWVSTAAPQAVEVQAWADSESPVALWLLPDTGHYPAFDEALVGAMIDWILAP